MENNKSQFKRTGVLHDRAECIEIQISHSGDAYIVKYGKRLYLHKFLRIY